MSRNRLHVNKINEFKEWLISQGWKEQDIKSCWEVFRMTHDDYKTLIVHQKMDAKVHCTLHGAAESWFSKFMRNKNKLNPTNK